MKKSKDSKRFEERFEDWLKADPEPGQRPLPTLSSDHILRQEKLRRWSFLGAGALGAVAAIWLAVFFVGLPFESGTNEIALDDPSEIGTEAWTESEEALTNLFILEDELAGLDWQADEDDEFLAQLLFPNS